MHPKSDFIGWLSKNLSPDTSRGTDWSTFGSDADMIVQSNEATSNIASEHTRVYTETFPYTYSAPGHSAWFSGGQLGLEYDADAWWMNCASCEFVRGDSATFWSNAPRPVEWGILGLRDSAR